MVQIFEVELSKMSKKETIAGFRIDCHQVFYTAGFTDILSAITFSAYPGECIGLLGPSGAGKSTLLKTAVGYYGATKGKVLYNGCALDEVYDEIKVDLGYVPQDDLVHPSLTPLDELTFAAQLRLPPDKTERALEKRVKEVLRLMDLHERAETRISSLSGGQRKRVSMGVELLTEPPVLFLDEPTSGLDPALEERMMHLFKKLADQGRTIILTTHIMETLEALDYALILHRGRLCFFGPPKKATEYFKVSTFTDIYKLLEKRQPREWEQAFKASKSYEEYVSRRLSSGPNGANLMEEYRAAKQELLEKEASGEGPAPSEGGDEGGEEAAPENIFKEPVIEPKTAKVSEKDSSIDDELEAMKRELGK